MGLHDRALLRRQLARLQQNRVGNRNLAHIVQRRRMTERRAEVWLHTNLFGQQHREASDPLDMCARVLVPELDCHRQSAYGLSLRDLEL